MKIRITLFLVGIALSKISAAGEEIKGFSYSCLPNKSASAGAPLEKGTFSPPNTIMVADGSTYRLIGLIAENLENIELERRKQEEIEQFLGRPDLSLMPALKQKKDRYGRIAAFACDNSQGPVRSLQEDLLEKGLARISTERLKDACAQYLLSLEQRARDKKLGLWKLREYGIKNSDRLHLSAILSTYQIIAGKVMNVSRRPNGISYLNFGHDWSRDFTVTLGKSALRAWEAKNKSLDDLENATIYVRGWVERNRGPLIRITDPNQLKGAE